MSARTDTALIRQPSTVEISIIEGRPVITRTRYERPQRFASLRRHGSDAWLIAMSAAGIAAGVIGWAHGVAL